MTQPETYRARAILLPHRQVDYLALNHPSENPGRQGSFYAHMLQSVPVLRAVLQQEFTWTTASGTVSAPLMHYFGAASLQQALPSLAGILEVESQKGGSITVEVSTGSAVMAAAVPNALVREFVAADRRRRTQHVSEQVAFIDKRLTEVQAELAATEQALAQFRRRNRDLVDGESVFTNPDLVVEHSRLQREVDIRSSLLKTLLNQHEVARLAAKKEFRGVEVLAWAETPERPLRRQPNQQVLLGAAAGLMASVMLAFMLEYGRRSKEAGRMQPIIDDLHSDAQRLRNLLTRTQR